jgi:MoaA/NifB/PqqE/SkfB family radical SAM enzyme
LIAKARTLGLDGISFLAADVSSTAFGRRGHARPRDLLLSREEVSELRGLIDSAAAGKPEAFARGFVAEPPERLHRIAQYYAAMLGDEPFPLAACDAPRVSAVVEANGDVRPCFFHPAIGNVRRTPLPSLVRRALPAFRSSLVVTRDETSRRCVCSLKVNWSHVPWS